MSTKYTTGKNAPGLCDICGFRYKLRQLKDVFSKGRNSHIKACPECWDADHPQLRVGELRIHDPQAVRDPRSDAKELTASRELTAVYDSYSVTGTAQRGTGIYVYTPTGWAETLGDGLPILLSNIDGTVRHTVESCRTYTRTGLDLEDVIEFKFKGDYTGFSTFFPETIRWTDTLPRTLDSTEITSGNGWTRALSYSGSIVSTVWTKELGVSSGLLYVDDTDYSPTITLL